MDEIIAWAAPIASTIIVTAATASINAHIKRRDQVADERHAETEAKRKAEAEWRSSAVGQVNVSTSGVITGFNFGASSSYWGFLLSYPVD